MLIYAWVSPSCLFLPGRLIDLGYVFLFCHNACWMSHLSPFLQYIGNLGINWMVKKLSSYCAFIRDSNIKVIYCDHVQIQNNQKVRT